MLRTCLAVLCLSALTLAASPGTEPTIPLQKDWKIQASAKVKATGAAISKPGFAAKGWYAAEVPCTVLGALVNDGVYKDLFVGKNLESVQKQQFQGSWWYRTEFTGGADTKRTYTRLIFDGVNYRANVWLNGKQIATKNQLFGIWRVFDYDVTKLLREGTNALAVEVFPPQPLDFAMAFADWNPAPPDQNMGLFRAVKLRRSGVVSIENAFVQTKVNLQTLDSADLTISAELVNHGEKPVEVAITGEIGDIHFDGKYSLGPNEKKPVQFTAAEVAALHIDHPRLWWPVHMGEPNLYTLKLSAGESDTQSVTFGIREVADYMTPEGARGYMVNGRKLLIRGGGWADQIFLHEDAKNLEQQIRYVKHMNLNTIRMEGFWGTSQTIYDLADRNGILIMPGFSCVWEWDHYKGKPADTEEYGAAKLPGDVDLQTAYLRDQVRALRNHPSIFVWVVGSDKLPFPEVEGRYRDDLKQVDPTRPYLSSCKGKTSEVSGPSGVKMLGPYNYVTPNFWFADRKQGGAYGFNTETGPGPQVPPLASLRRMIPADKLWPINDVWNYHCALHVFGNLDIYLNAFDHRYGKATSVEDFAFRAQAANYEAIRAMFEAFGANKPAATGIIQWMLNAAWPKLYWQLYDYYLMPGGAYFGVRKGSQPLNVVYDYAAHAIYLVNDTSSALDGANVRVKLLDVNSQVVFEQQVRASVPAGESRKVVLSLPALTGKSPVYFLDLKLDGAGTNRIAENFYWLSPKEDVMEPEKYTQNAMTNSSYADFTALNQLAPATVKTDASCAAEQCEVTLTNTSDRVAFFLEMQVVGDGSAQPVLPVLWDDNYVSLLPGEAKTFRAHFAAADLNGEKPRFTMKGWNVAEVK